MTRDYWTSLAAFLAGFAKRAAVFLGVGLYGAVETWTAFEPFLGVTLTDAVSPAFFWGVVGIGLLWAAFETYRQKVASEESVEWDRDTYRAMRLREWREKVRDYDGRYIYDVSCWSEMREHLDSDLVENLESGVSLRPRYTAGREFPSDKELVLDDLARLEKEWSLL